MEIKITTPFIKLDQLLKFSGLVSTGGEAKEVILQGLVKVNGDTVIQRGKKIYPGDEIFFNNDSCKVI